MKQPSMGEAGLRIAVEMERRGCDLFVRARQLTDDPALIALLDSLAREEALHRQFFIEMLDRIGGEPLSLEENALLASKAADFFFPGGLMRVAMHGALASVEALLDEAAQAERDSIAFYTRLLSHLDEADGETIRGIIGEEEIHLTNLMNQKKMLTEEKKP